MHKKFLIQFFLCLSLICGAFFFGVYYSSVEFHKRSVIYFANVIGDHTVVVNNIYSEILNNDLNKKRNTYNMFFLISIGCSSWKSDLDRVSNRDLQDFLLGINIALLNSKSSLNKNDFCLNSFFEWWENRK